MASPTRNAEFRPFGITHLALASASLCAWLQWAAAATPGWKGPVIALFWTMAVYLADGVRDARRVGEIGRPQARRLTVAVFACGAAAIAGALLWVGPLAAVGLTMALIPASFYASDVAVPGLRAGRTRRFSLKTIPGAKGLEIAGGLVAVWALLATASAGSAALGRIALGGAFLVVLVYTNAAFGDLRDVETDRRDGVPTLPLTLGRQPTLALLLAANLLAAPAWWRLARPAIPLPLTAGLAVALAGNGIACAVLLSREPRSASFYDALDVVLYLPLLVSAVAALA